MLQVHAGETREPQKKGATSSDARASPKGYGQKKRGGGGFNNHYQSNKGWNSYGSSWNKYGKRKGDGQSHGAGKAQRGSY